MIGNLLFEMREIENDFKRFYRNSNLNIFNTPFERDELIDILKNAPEKHKRLFFDNFYSLLTEDIYFEDKEDIAVYQHYRYMPPLKHSHDFFEIAFVLSGALNNSIGEHNLPLYPGDILIIAPHTEHAVWSYDDDGIMINILIRSSTFDENFMKILPDNNLLQDLFIKTLHHPSNTSYLLFKIGEDEDLMNCVMDIYSEFNLDRIYKNTVLTALISIFLVTLLRNHEKDVILPSIHPSVMNETTIRILQYMQTNYTTVTLSELAKNFKYSERQMQRIITAATGSSFTENIRKLRMQQAAYLLKHTSKNVTEIAFSLGYYDASNFRHVFKETYHVTPKQYRDSLELTR